MKKLLSFLFFFLPVFVSAQLNQYKDSPLNYGWKNVGNEGFSAGLAVYTSLAFSPSGQPYVAFQDWGDSKKATVMTFNGTNWVNIGSAGFSAGVAYDESLAISPSGQPYVAYMDGMMGPATVMKFDGNSWINVGIEGFSAGEATWISLAFNSIDGQPYVAFQDWGHSKMATVMKFDGINWVNVGNAGFSGAEADWTSLAFSLTGEPYVAYEDWGHSNKATVMKFDGNNWVGVGNAGFSAGEANCTSLALSPTDSQPYVAYLDQGTFPYGSVTVMKFDGTNWVDVGPASFTGSNCMYPSLAFSPYGQPYVAYSDEPGWEYGMVVKFDGTNWVFVGVGTFSGGFTQYNSLVFNPANCEPYVAYYDAADSGKATVTYYDGPVGINELHQSMLSIYPNPAIDKITVETSGETQESYLSIVNIEGEQLLTSQITQSKTQLDISSLSSGVYFVRLTNDRSVEVGKFVKQ